MNIKVYGSEICSDCRAFKQLVEERKLDVEYIDITKDVANLRDFLRLRDTESAYDEIRREGRIGIPSFVRDDGTLTLDMNEALAWMGEPPYIAPEGTGCASCG